MKLIDVCTDCSWLKLSFQICMQPVDVAKLVKARPLDNMEFMQWFKAYYDSHAPAISDYDPWARRATSKTGDMKVRLKRLAKLRLAAEYDRWHSPHPSVPPAGLCKVSASRSVYPCTPHGRIQLFLSPTMLSLMLQGLKPAGAAARKKQPSGGGSSGPTSVAGTPRSQVSSRKPFVREPVKEAAAPPAAKGLSGQQSMSDSEASTYAQIQELTEQVGTCHLMQLRQRRACLARSVTSDPHLLGWAFIKQLSTCFVQVTDLKLKVDNVERERDFYFDKLRDIEILCQTPELSAVPVRPF